MDEPAPVRIPLTRGKFALVDPKDAELLQAFKWRAALCSGRWVAVTSHHGGKFPMQMHSLIMEAERGQAVDHRNGDTLDNRRANLRFPTGNQNNANLHKVRSASGFKGVFRFRNKWRAAIKVNRRIHHLGMFSTPEDAARAYDAAALEHFGEFACTNESLGLLSPSI